MRNSWGKLVEELSAAWVQTGGLYAGVGGRQLGVGYKPSSLRTVMPLALPGLIPAYWATFTPVFTTLFPTIHTTNKESDKLYIPNFSRRAS